MSLTNLSVSTGACGAANAHATNKANAICGNFKVIKIIVCEFGDFFILFFSVISRIMVSMREVTLLCVRLERSF